MPAEGDIERRQIKLAWAAGFFDGEGCVAALEWVRPTGRVQHQLFLDVTQSSVDPLLEFMDIFGGKVHQDRPRYHGLSKRPIFHWRLYGASRVAFALSEMLPYLILKTPHAEAALELSDLFGGYPLSESVI